MIGVDLDNTMIDCGDAMHVAAVRSALVSRTVPRDVKQIRAIVRGLPDGQTKWQRLQGQVYGSQLHRARLYPGVREFFQRCRSVGQPVKVVSHKTELAHFTDIRLREVAREWLRQHGAFAADGLALAEEGDLFFEPTRAAKIERIRELRCIWFVDDLAEIFVDPRFPVDTNRILFDPHGGPAPPGVTVCASWAAIGAKILDCI